MEIYSFKLKTKTNANIFIIDTSIGEFVLHSDIIVKYKIEKGTVNNNIFNEAVRESEILIGLNLCLKYISGKLKTEKQIKDYLYKKEFNKPAVEAIIEKLKEYNIINDEIYAETYAKNNPNFSRNKIKQKLMSVGVKSDVTELATVEVDDFSSCVRQTEKYMRNKVADKQTIEKLIRRLQGMGYNWDAIKYSLNKLKFDMED